MRARTATMAALLAVATAAPISLLGQTGPDLANSRDAGILGGMPFLSLTDSCGPACSPAPATPQPRAAIGERYPTAHLVTAPGRYGLSNPPQGEAYAVIGTSLVRVDLPSFEVLSILRPVEGLRD